MHLLILGCGDIGTRVGSSMADAGWSVSAARRNAGTLSERFDRHQVDLTDPASMAALPVRDPDYILVTPTPQSYDPMGYRKGFTEAAELLAAQPWLLACSRVIWVSSTRVYREAEGGWVDEHSPLNVSEPQARAMVAAEAAIRRARTTTVIRPAGVYGDPQGMLIRRVLSGQGGAPGSSFGNRIHREDLARLITHCLQLDEQGKAVPPTLVAADEDTTPTYEVERWLAQKLGVNLSETPQQAISRANRQCRSALLKEIGFTLTYPSWREGYSAAINV